MGKTAKDIINEKLALKTKLESDIRFEFLQKNGLVHREYAEAGAVRSAEYPIYDMTTNRFYRLVADMVSDEEYDLMKSLDQQITVLKPTPVMEPSDHGTSALLVASAVFVYVFGFLYGVFAIFDMSLITGLIAWIGAFVFGSLLLGMKEIIRLLISNRH